MADTANLDKLADKAKNLVSEENLGKLTDTAKGLADTTKSALHASGVIKPPPELTERQSEIAEDFGYTVKGGEKIIFASEEADLMLTSRAFLYGGLRTEPETVIHEKAGVFSIYFATGWRYVRVYIETDEYHIFDGIELDEDETIDFCRTMIDAFVPERSGEAVQDGAFFANIGNGWTLSYQPELIQTYLDNFSQECGFKLAPGEEPLFIGTNIVEFMLTNKNLLINMGYHPA